MRLIMLTLLIASFSFSSIACKKKPETTGEKIDNAVDEGADRLDKAADDLQGKGEMEKAGEKIGEGAQKAGEKVDEAAEKTGDKINEAADKAGDKIDETTK